MVFVCRKFGYNWWEEDKCADDAARYTFKPELRIRSFRPRVVDPISSKKSLVVSSFQKGYGAGLFIQDLQSWVRSFRPDPIFTSKNCESKSGIFNTEHPINIRCLQPRLTDPDPVYPTTVLPRVVDPISSIKCCRTGSSTAQLCIRKF